MTEIKLMIGGEERPLHFGTMEVLELVGDVYDGDPFDLLSVTKEPAKAYGGTLAVVYSGLRAAGCTASKEEIKTWVRRMDFQEGVSAYAAFIEAYTPKNVDVGEVPAREQVESD